MVPENAFSLLIQLHTRTLYCNYHIFSDNNDVCCAMFIYFKDFVGPSLLYMLWYKTKTKTNMRYLTIRPI